MRLLGDHLEMLPNGQSVKLSMVFPTLVSYILHIELDNLKFVSVS